MPDKLRVEYDSLTQLAAMLAKEAADLEELPKRIAYHADYLQRCGWSGDSAIKFFGELVEVLDPATWKMIALLWDISDLINNLVRLFRQAEEAVAALFSGVGSQDITAQIVSLEKALNAAKDPAATKAVAEKVDQLFAEKMRQIMGKDIDLNLGGTKDFTTREKLLVLETFSELPKTLVSKSMLDGLARYDKLPQKTADYNPDTKAINMTDSAYDDIFMKRYGLSSKEHAFQAILLHEMAHSIQYDKNGNFSPLMEDYAKKFGYRVIAIDGSLWQYKGKISDMPGADDRSSMYPVGRMTGQEDMAEAITFYRYAPERLSQERYNWVRDNIYNGQEFK
jgi:WXG100 family type VII secretion target